MANSYLINDVLIGTVKYKAGSLITAADPTSQIVAAGGILWPATDALVAASALMVQAMQKGGEADAALPIMAAAPLASLLATSVQKVSQSIAFGVDALPAATTFDKAFAAALPANARFVAATIDPLTGFDDATHAAYTTTLGSAAGGTQLGASTVVTTGQAAKAFAAGSTLGFTQAPIGGITPNIRLTGGVNLSTVTSGSMTVNVYYVVLA